ncbi:MAG: hypothetical protein WD709_08025 [Gammaproteobacteria bacterium]
MRQHLLSALSGRHGELLFVAALYGFLLLTGWVYSAGITGPLLFDDFWNLQPLADGGGINSWDSFRRFVFDNDSGPTGRPVSMLSFVMNAQDWPPSVTALKYTNIMIHLLCGLALFWFALLLSERLGQKREHSLQIALFVTALWLLHPLNVSTTLYIIQRMTQLMTLFALLALVCYLKGRFLAESSPRTALLWLGLCLFPFALLSVLSKENGALLLLLIVVMELTLFRQMRIRGIYRTWFVVGVVTPLLIVGGYLLVSLPENLARYEIRNFTLGERLLTETRVLLDYLSQIAMPSLNSGQLFFDDLTVSRSLIDPVSTLFSTLLLLFLLGSALWWRKRQPVYSFAVLWFFAMHLLESTYIPLELYFEHRNYLPMIGPLFAGGWYLRLFLSSGYSQRLANTARLLLLLFVSLLTAITWSTTSLWGNEALLKATWAQQRPGSTRAQLVYSQYLKAAGLPELALQRAELARQQQPNEITVLLFIWSQACDSGLEAPFTLGDIAENPDLEYHRDDINQTLRILVEDMQAQKCEYPPIEDLLALFERVGELPLTHEKRVGYHIYFSDVYTHMRRLDPALIQLSRAFGLNPDPRFPIRQSILSASAGNFADALVFLDRAEAADRARNPLLPSQQQEIDRLRQIFQRRVAEQEDTVAG